MFRRAVSWVLFLALCAFGVAVVPGASTAVAQPDRAGGDGIHAPDPGASSAAEAAGLAVRWDPVTGLPRHVAAARGDLAKAQGDRGQALLRWLRDHRAVYGLDASDLAGIRVDKQVVAPHSAATYVYLQQYDGPRRVYDAGAVGVFDTAGRLVSVASRLFTGAHGEGTGLGARDATQAGAKSLGLSGEAAVRRTHADGSVTLSNPFARGLKRPDDVVAEPVTVRTGDNAFRAAWLVSVEVDPVRYYDLAVDAGTGDALLRQNRYFSSEPHGTVWTTQNPSTAGARVQVPFNGWVADRATSGNNANVYEDRDGNNASDYQTQTPASGDPNYQHFDYGFANAWANNADGTAASLDADRDAVLTQLFYWVNYTHDRLLGLGFNEASGNFQVDNLGNGGTGGDAVQAEAYDGFSTGASCNANFNTGNDGSTARLQVFVGDGSSSSCPYRLSELEGDTVVHEYGHGVFRRLVNGGNGVGSGVQLGGMNEGNSDTLAFAFFNDPIIFEYDSGNATTGLRRVAYNTSTWTYSSICNAGCEVHNDGEVWATATWDVRELMVAKYGLATATPRFERLILDGLRATPSSADFLDGRDGILTADAAGGAADKCLIWGAFTRTGMGLSATTSANQQTVTEARDVPTECRPVADAGGPYSTPEGTDVALSATGSTKGSDPSAGAIASYAWDLDNDGQYDDATGASPSFTSVGDNGTFTVGVQVTDAYGQTSTDTATVTVTNVPPTVTLDAIASAAENSPTSISGVVTDPGWLDSLTATVDWGDGAGPQPLTGTTENSRPDATLTFATTHTYGDNGSFSVTVCGNDDDGGSACTSRTAVVTNVDPTALIDESGQQTYDGVQAFILKAGQPVAIPGSSTDPGSDDLTFLWDWDGPLLNGETPDSETSLVNPPATDPPLSPTVQPRDVSLSKSHAFGSACLYNMQLKVTDDDGGNTADNTAILITGNATVSKGHGWWLNQYRPKGDTFDAATLQCYLNIVNFMSMVFSEKTQALTRAQAEKILNAPAKAPEAVIFDQMALGAWLNFANGSIRLSSPVDSNGDGINDSTFGAVMFTAESVRINPASTSAQIKAQKTIVERIALQSGP